VVSEWRAEIVVWQPKRVVGVAELVDRRGERAKWIVLVEPGGDPGVKLVARGERMRRGVEPATVEVVAKQFQHLTGERLLSVGIEGSLKSIGRKVGVRRTDFLDQGYQRLSEFIKNLSCLFERQTRLVLRKQHGIGVGVGIDVRGVLAFELDEAFEMWSKLRKVVVFAGGLPRTEGLGGRRRDLLDEITRDAGSPNVLPTNLTDDSLLFGCERCVVKRLKLLANIAVDQQFVADRRQCRQLCRAGGGSALGHYHLLIPREHLGRTLDGVVPGDLIEQFRIRRWGLSLCCVGCHTVCCGYDRINALLGAIDYGGVSATRRYSS